MAVVISLLIIVAVGVGLFIFITLLDIAATLGFGGCGIIAFIALAIRARSNDEVLNSIAGKVLKVMFVCFLLLLWRELR